VSAKIKKQCPDINWKGSFATLGRFDVVDLLEAEDPKQIEKAAMIIRAYGHSTTKANREGGDDYSCLWTFHDGEARRDSLEGVPGYTLKSFGAADI
jgi:hypothetical protein